MIEPISLGAAVAIATGFIKALEKVWDYFTKKEDFTLTKLQDGIDLLHVKVDKFSDTMLQVASSLERHGLTLDRVIARMDADDMVDSVVEKFQALSLKTRS